MISLALAYFHPTCTSLLMLRWAMIVIAVCSRIGFYEHMEHKYEFRKVIKPKATPAESVLATVQGDNPVRASGILRLRAVIGLAATYQHEVLGSR